MSAVKHVERPDHLRAAADPDGQAILRVLIAPRATLTRHDRIEALTGDAGETGRSIEMAA